MMPSDNSLPKRPQLSPGEQRAEAEALFTSIGEGAISTDEFGRITRINPPAQEIIGYSEEELVGSWFPEKVVALTLDDKPINLIDRPITRAFLTGHTVSEKAYYRRKNGTKVAVAITVSAILIKGRPIGGIEVFRDITHEQEVDRLKSEFISLASHQLKTPLSAIKTYTHMLSDGYMGKLNESQMKSLGTIISATDRMNELISTLLNITRLETGTIAVTPKLLHIDKLTEEVIKELSLMASAKDIKLTIVTKGTASTAIKTDSLITREILTNLIANAIKYTPDGGNIKIIISPRPADVLVSVKDSGWGIPKQSHEQIFSKFFRAPNIVKRETTGTGLGLYMVKGLLDVLGGNINFKSTEGKGTTFSFTLPRSKRVGKVKNYIR